MATKKEIWDELKKLSEEMRTVQNSQLKLMSAFDSEKLVMVINQLNAGFRDLSETTKKNLDRVNAMAQELKGIVSMARAALDEGKKFTQMTELTNMLAQVAGDVYRLDGAVDRLNKISDKLLVSCEVPCTKESSPS